MATALSSILLLIVTVVAIRAHLRRVGGASHGSAAPRVGRRCPRCRGEVPGSRDLCPSCGAPQQAYEIVTAAQAADEPAGGETGGQPHAIVRADVCVGCGTCVDACPEAGAIRLVDKQAVVDLDHCTGHGRCVEACPVGGILLTTGEAVQRVEVPRLDVHFQSEVPGLYIVGELGGRGLIKNAVNEGKLAVEHVASLARSDWKRPSGPAGACDVLIVGSGPAGLSAALEARRLGLSYALLERGSLADSIRKYPRHKVLLAEPVRVPLYGDLWIADASKESLLKVWETVVRTSGLEVRTGQEVRNISREDGVFRVETADRTWHTRRVVLAMGRRGTPRRLGVPGEDLGKVVYDIVEMEAFAGRTVMVVGGGDSAVESAVGLSRQTGTDVTLSYRGSDFRRVKDRNRAKLDDAVSGRRLRLLLNSQVLEIRQDAVLVDCEGTTSLLPNDDVIVRIGGEPPFDFLRRLGVSIVKKDIRIGGSETQAHANAAV